jgi:hypothetical protein
LQADESMALVRSGNADAAAAVIRRGADDAPFRDAVREHVEFGSGVAMQNSRAESEAELHPLREVPRWTWAGDD